MFSSRKVIYVNCLSRLAYLVTTTSCPVENIKSFSSRGGKVPQ